MKNEKEKKMKERKRTGRRKERKRINITMNRRAGAIQLSNTFPKRESIVVKFQEKSEMCYCISSRIPVVVEPSTFMKNVPSSFNRILTARTLKYFLREESEVIFSYGSMIDDGS